MYCFGGPIDNSPKMIIEKIPIPPLQQVIDDWKNAKGQLRLGQYFMNKYRVTDAENGKLWEADEREAKIILLEMYTRYQWG